MNPLLVPWLQPLLPARVAISGRERLRASTGALLGIGLTGLVGVVLSPSSTTAMWLMAPMGASAVLLFGVPASPLAQPWSIVGGNLVSALIGVTCARAIDGPLVAAAIAIFVAIAAMFALRCLHPPSGAVALTAVLGGADVHAAGYAFVVVPVALNTLLLLAVALFYNNATGRRYPHPQQAEPRHPHGTVDGPPMERLGFSPADLQAVLQEYDQVLDVSVDDLELLFHRTEMQAFRRRFGQMRCADLMSRDVIAVEFATELGEAWRQMREHAVQALPVVDRARHVIGIVTRWDFIEHVDPSEHRGMRDRLRSFLQRNRASHSTQPEVVGQIMTAPVRTASSAMTAVELVPLMTDAGVHHVPVVDDARKLVGMVSQTDLVAALYEVCLSRLPQAA